jgi:hypothetical protein
VKEQVDRGVNLYWMSGKQILANPMTKAVYQLEHDTHAREVQGLKLHDIAAPEPREVLPAKKKQVKFDNNAQIEENQKASAPRPAVKQL